MRLLRGELGVDLADTPVALNIGITDLEEYHREGLPEYGEAFQEKSGGEHSATADPRQKALGRRLASWRSWRSLYIFGLLLSDSVAAAVALTFSYLVRPAVGHYHVDLLDWRVSYKLLGLVSLGVWLVALALGGAYRGHYPAGDVRQYRVRVATAVRLMALVVIASFVLRAAVSRVLVLAYFPSLAVASIFAHWVLGQVVSRLRRGGYALNRLVLAGDEASVTKLVDHFLRDPSHGFQVVGVCVPGGSAVEQRSLHIRGGSYPIVGGPDGLVEATRILSADTAAIVGDLGLKGSGVQQVAWQLERRDVDLLIAPDVIDVAGPRIRFAPVTGMPLLQIHEPRIYGPGRWLKPWYERTLALVLLVLAAPVFLAVSVAILLDSGRPIFYRQRRIGFGGQEFEMLKFRSMVQGADAMLPDLLAENEHVGALFKMHNDPRVTRIGRFLRKHSIDELAQLINVAKGEMLLVGPRPCLPRETEGFGEAARRRFLARPGMTGLWQVSGRSDIPWDEAVRLDLYYVENWSPVMDLVILLRTLRVVVGGSGGY